MKLPLVEKFICLAIIPLIQFISFLKCIYLRAYIFLQINSSCFSKMASVRFQYEPVSLDLNEVWFEEEQDSPITGEKLRKSQSVTEWCRCGKWDLMHTNVEHLGCGKVEALGYFQLSYMRYDDSNVVTERVSTTFLQLYLIWTPAQI